MHEEYTVYIFSCCSDNSGIALDSIEKFDLKTLVWKEGGRLPEGIYGASKIPLEDGLFLIGGAPGDGKTVYKYKESNDSWIVESEKLSRARRGGHFAIEIPRENEEIERESRELVRELRHDEMKAKKWPQLKSAVQITPIYCLWRL